MLARNIRSIVESLNHTNGCDDNEKTMRILKITEEMGEVTEKWIDVRGQNPRKSPKGYVESDVAEELADVALTALVAIKSLGYDPMTILGIKTAEAAYRLEWVVNEDGL